MDLNDNIASEYDIIESLRSLGRCGRVPECIRLLRIRHSELLPARLPELLELVVVRL